MCENFKFESELKVSFCLSGSSLHEDHQVYVYVSTFYQLINSHIKRTQWQYRAVKSRNQLSQPKYGWPNCFFLDSGTSHIWESLAEFYPFHAPKGAGTFHSASQSKEGSVGFGTSQHPIFMKLWPDHLWH